jgi:hypothetical protein
LIQLNGKRRSGTHRDGTVGLILDVDEFSSMSELSTKAWINWSEEIEEELRAQFFDDIIEAASDRGD